MKFDKPKLGTLFLCSLLLWTGDVSCVEPASASPPEIVDIKSWKHPTKSVFAKYKIELTKVVLESKNTYPTFYATLIADPQSSANEVFYNKFYGELLAANGWWSYQIRNEQDQLMIKVNWDKKTKTMTTEFEPLKDATGPSAR